MKVAIVTGASSGIGREFARQIDRLGDCDEIWLVARREGRLNELAATFSKARGRVFALDLTTPGGIAPLFETLATEKGQIRWLVNNAGFGYFGAIDKTSLEDNLKMVDLNVRALTEMTQRALPFCGRGTKIVQVASTGGFFSMPYFAIYGATKAYVVSLSEALHAELGDRGITVTAVCPGPVATEFFDVAASQMQQAAAPGFFMATPEAVARKAIADARAGNMHSIYNVLIWAGVGVGSRLPRWLTIGAMKLFWPYKG